MEHGCGTGLRVCLAAGARGGAWCRLQVLETQGDVEASAGGVGWMRALTNAHKWCMCSACAGLQRGEVQRGDVQPVAPPAVAAGGDGVTKLAAACAGGDRHNLHGGSGLGTVSSGSARRQVLEVAPWRGRASGRCRRVLPGGRCSRWSLGWHGPRDGVVGGGPAAGARGGARERDGPRGLPNGGCSRWRLVSVGAGRTSGRPSGGCSRWRLVASARRGGPRFVAPGIWCFIFRRGGGVRYNFRLDRVRV